jgi:hypothetical protein
MFACQFRLRPLAAFKVGSRVTKAKLHKNQLSFAKKGKTTTLSSIAWEKQFAIKRIAQGKK